MQTQPEEQALLALHAMRVSCTSMSIDLLGDTLLKAVLDATKDKVFSEDVSPVLAAITLCNVLTLVLGRSVGTVAELLSHCEVVTKEDENFSDLFQLALADLLIEGTTKGIKETSREFLLSVNKELKEAGLRNHSSIQE